MAHLDAFSAQIVKFVREMPDEALLELVKQKLGVLGIRREAAAIHDGRQGPHSRAQKGATKDRARPARPRRASPAPAAAERQSMIDNVERVVKSGSGMSASEVAHAAGIPQTRAAAALKELKLTKKIYQGGDRRFARYAGDAKTAEQASAHARKTAKGPTVSNGKNGARNGAGHEGASALKAALNGASVFDGGSKPPLKGGPKAPLKVAQPAASKPGLKVGHEGAKALVKSAQDGAAVSKPAPKAGHDGVSNGKVRVRKRVHPAAVSAS